MRRRTAIRTFGLILLMTAVTWGLGATAHETGSAWNEEASKAEEQNDKAAIEQVSNDGPNNGDVYRHQTADKPQVAVQEQPAADNAADEVPSQADQTKNEESIDTAEDGEVVGVSESLDSHSDKSSIDPPADQSDISAAEKDFGFDLSEIDWWDFSVQAPEIEPLYVRAFTEITKGHNDSNPIWSPTGKLIAFERSIEDKREIIISRSDGSVLQKIYHRRFREDTETDSLFADVIEDVSFNAGIAWSPDENRLVFMSNGGSGNYDLYLLPGLGQKSPIRLTEDEAKDSHPHWSPVADRLVFVSGRAGNADIYLMDLASRRLTQLTNGHKTFLYPQWSPDGEKIVMIYGSNENHDIYMIEDVNRPAQTLKALTQWNYDDLRPVWSPDGKKIAFYSNYNLENNPKVWCIIVIAADGSDPVAGPELAQKVVAVNVIPDSERGPAWMPDSKRIIYVKKNHQAYNPLYMVDIERKQDQVINTQTKMNHDVSCSADGTLAFRAQVEQWDHIYIAMLKEFGLDQMMQHHE